MYVALSLFFDLHTYDGQRTHHILTICISYGGYSNYGKHRAHSPTPAMQAPDADQGHQQAARPRSAERLSSKASAAAYPVGGAPRGIPPLHKSLCASAQLQQNLRTPAPPALKPGLCGCRWALTTVASVFSLLQKASFLKLSSPVPPFMSRS